MSKPILNTNTSNAWDAKLSHDIRFQYYGNQSMKNRIIIRNNTTNIIVYDITQTTMLLQHTVAANAITNGTLYNIQVQTFDSLNVASELSDAVLFYCLDTPVFRINVTNNQIIRTPSYQVIIDYSQTQGDALQEYKICLYDTSHNEVYNTGARYSLSIPTIISGLDDNSTYYIQGFGRTVNNMSIETELLVFTVDYIQPILYAFLKPENRPEQGDILLTMNFISIEGHMDNGASAQYTTVNNKTFLNLQEGQTAIFDDGFTVSGNYTLNIKVRNISNIVDNTCPFLILSNSEGHKIELFINTGIFTSTGDTASTYVELRATQGDLVYTIYSNYVDASGNNIVSVWLNKSNKLYNIFIESLGV